MPSKYKPKEKGTCKICGKVTFYIGRCMKSHQEKPIKPKPEFKCSHCEKVFCSNSNRGKHFEAFHLNLRKHKCHICNKTFNDLSALRIHLKRHKADPNNKTHHCRQCVKTFKIEEELKVHVKHRHTQFYQEKCDFCGKILNSIESIRYHLKAVHSRRDIKCPECEETFTIDRLLRGHIDRMHNPIRQRTFKCSECDKAFYQSGDLRNHKRYIHNPKDNKKYFCESCDKSFVQPGGLYIHNQSVHQDKQYKCEYCDKIFGLKVILKRHMYRHTGEMPFKCNQSKCEQSFKSPSELKSHSLMHAEGRPYRCPTCDIGFHHNRYLLSHYKSSPGHELVKG